MEVCRFESGRPLRGSSSIGRALVPAITNMPTGPLRSKVLRADVIGYPRGITPVMKTCPQATQPGGTTVDPLATISTRRTPQTQPASQRQIPNSAGGYAFAVADEVRIRRFLT